MSFEYIAVIGVFAITLVMVKPSIAESQTVKKCLKLNDITITTFEKESMKDILRACMNVTEKDRANLTTAAEVIYTVYKDIQEDEYPYLEKLGKDKDKLEKMSICEKNTTAKEFPSSDMQKKVERCNQLFKLGSCVENVFYETSRLTIDSKHQKDILMKAFSVATGICEQVMIREDRNRSQQLIPSVIILGSALIVLHFLHLL